MTWRRIFLGPVVVNGQVSVAAEVSFDVGGTDEDNILIGGQEKIDEFVAQNYGDEVDGEYVHDADGSDDAIDDDELVVPKQELDEIFGDDSQDTEYTPKPSTKVPKTGPIQMAVVHGKPDDSGTATEDQDDADNSQTDTANVSEDKAPAVEEDPTDTEAGEQQPPTTVDEEPSATDASEDADEGTEEQAPPDDLSSADPIDSNDRSSDDLCASDDPDCILSDEEDSGEFWDWFFDDDMYGVPVWVVVIGTMLAGYFGMTAVQRRLDPSAVQVADAPVAPAVAEGRRPSPSPSRSPERLARVAEGVEAGREASAPAPDESSNCQYRDTREYLENYKKAAWI